MENARRAGRLALTLGGLFLIIITPALAEGPGVVKFDEDSYSSNEGSTVQVVVERSQGEDGAASVRVVSNGGSATAGSDYPAVNALLEWADGDGSNRSVAVELIDDSEAEGSETIELALADATGASIDPTRASSVIRISANGGGDDGPGDDGPGDDGPGDDGPGDDGPGDDGPGDDGPGDDGPGDDGPGDDGPGDDGGGHGILKFDERTYLANERARKAVITVERSHGESGAVTVSYAATAGTATAGSDFEEVTGTLSWADDDGSLRSFEVPIVADDIAEPNETVELMLFSPTGGAVLSDSRSTSTLIIIGSGNDNPDAPGTISFDETSFEVIEGQAQALVRVERSGGETGAVSVSYSTSPGSASDGLDYAAVSGTLSWANGDETDKTFAIPILDDDIDEGNETINLQLSAPTGGATLGAATSLVNILDDDGTGLPCEPGDDSGCVSNSRFSFEVIYRTGNGLTGRGHVVPLSDNSAIVWFFNANNVEMLIKVLDACSLQARPAYWVFFSATTNVDYTVRVTDTHTGVTRDYRNLLGQPAQPVLDTATFQTCAQ